MNRKKCNRKEMSMYKRMLSQIKEHWWFIIGIAFAIVTAIGTYGYSILLAGYDRASWLDYFYHALQLYPAQYGVPLGMPGDFYYRFNGWLNFARFAAPVVLGFATINALWVFFQERYSRCNLKWFYKDHTIVCGLGEKGMQLVTLLKEHGEKVVVIERGKDNSNVDICKSLGVIVLLNNAADENILRLARIEKAKSVYAITGDDTVNIQVAKKVKELLDASSCKRGETETGKPDRLECYVHLYDLAMKSVFENLYLFQNRFPSFDARIFNIHEESSRKILELYPPDRYYREHMKEHEKTENGPVQVLVVGFGFMGESLVKQIIRVAHYDVGMGKVKITIVDKLAEEKKRQFLSLCERPKGFDLDLEFVSVDIEEIQDLASLNLPVPPDIAYVSLGSDLLGMSVSVRLRKIFGDKHTTVPVIVCQTSILSYLFGECSRENKLCEHRNIHPFNIIEQGIDDIARKHAAVEKMARFIHEDYFINAIIDKALKTQDNSTLLKELVRPANNLDDFHRLSIKKKLRTIQSNLSNIRRRDDCHEDLKSYTLKEWDDLDEETRDSNRYQADHISVKLRAMGLDMATDYGSIQNRLKNDDVREELAILEHRRWTAEKYVSGWRYGKIKDKNMRTHPDLVCFEKLSNAEQRKDEYAVINIPALVKIYREFQKTTQDSGNSDICSKVEYEYADRT